MDSKTILSVAALLGLLAVGLGAFGAHGLHTYLAQAQKTDTYELAVRYQFYHVFALLATGLLQRQSKQRHFAYAGASFTLGIAGFSGSLFALCFHQATWLALITPMGGLALILGWAFLFWGTLKGQGVLK